MMKLFIVQNWRKILTQKRKCELRSVYTELRSSLFWRIGFMR
nr:MAG TPA: hypothetical protein [Caudoviricetes sp.]